MAKDFVTGRKTTFGKKRGHPRKKAQKKNPAFYMRVLRCLRHN